MKNNKVAEKEQMFPASNVLRGKVAGVAIGEKRGHSKSQVPFIELKQGHGVLKDAHAGTEKQVSLVAIEDIEHMNKTYHINAGVGAFAENIATKGIELMLLSPGEKIQIGPAILRVTCLGKSAEDMKNHTFSYKGYTLLPQRGLFCEVLKGGLIKPGDEIYVLSTKQSVKDE